MTLSAVYSGCLLMAPGGMASALMNLPNKVPSNEVLAGMAPAISSLASHLEMGGVHAQPLRAIATLASDPTTTQLQADLLMRRLAVTTANVPLSIFDQAAFASALELGVRFPSTPSVDVDTLYAKAVAFRENAYPLFTPDVNFSDRYEVVGKIGEGSQSVVYLVKDRTSEDHYVARRAKSTADLQRFLDNANALARIDHPGVIRIREILEEPAGSWGDKDPVMVMEHVDAQPLSQVLSGQNHQFTEAELIEIRRQLLDAVSAAHEQGVIHRDIKPSNVLIRWDDGKPVVKLIDFGLAKFDGEATRSSSLGKGSLAYAAPEVWNAGKIMPATDIYGIGLVLIALAKGEERNDWVQKEDPKDDVSALRKRGNLISNLDAENGIVLPPLLEADYSRAFLDDLARMVDPDPAKRLQTLVPVKKVQTMDDAFFGRAYVISLGFLSGMGLFVDGHPVLGAVLEALSVTSWYWLCLSHIKSPEIRDDDHEPAVSARALPTGEAPISINVPSAKQEPVAVPIPELGKTDV
ncbi:MAG: serine/threonine protein kinase [Deltaproteobacteria bacterium]|nr:serine/threonine protein kinase [Deltaproteobacteria bacterium]